MKRLGLFLVVMLAVVSLLAAGCGGGGEEATPTRTATPISTPTVSPGKTATPAPTPAISPAKTPTPTPTKTPATGDNLSAILAIGKGIESVKYDMVVTAPGQGTTTTKVWLKGKKMKFESEMEGETSIQLIDGDKQVMYMYLPDQNMAIKMDFGTAPGSALEGTEEILDYDYKIIGTETVDGKSCLVVQWTVEGTTSKMWVWKDKGFPIKIETTTPEGKITIENKNIQFVSIPDSEFELPPGVEIVSF